MGRPKGSKGYSEEQRAEAFTVLAGNGGNVKATARETGIPESTVRSWKKEWERETPPGQEIVLQPESSLLPYIEEQADAFLTHALRVRSKLLTRIEEQIDADNGNMRDYSVSLGIIEDKIHRLTVVKNRGGNDDQPLQIDARSAGEMIAGFVAEAYRMSAQRDSAVIQATENEANKPLPAST